MTLPTVRERVKETMQNVLHCEHDGRGVLLSNPPQYKCKRDRCHKTWIVDRKPPVCEMFDVEAYTKHFLTADRTTLCEVLESKKLLEVEMPGSTYTLKYKQGYNKALDTAIALIRKTLTEKV